MFGQLRKKYTASSYERICEQCCLPSQRKADEGAVAVECGANVKGAAGDFAGVEVLEMTGLLDLCKNSGQPFLFTYQPPAISRIKMIFFMGTFLRASGQITLG